jgi:uncharacterized protein YggE
MRILVVAVLAATGLVVPPGATAQQPERPRSIDVTGEGSVVAPNDAARLTLSVELRRPDGRSALDGASARMRRVLRAAKAQDLAARAGTRLGRALRIREEGVELDSEGHALSAPRRRRARVPVRPGRSRLSARLTASIAPE